VAALTQQMAADRLRMYQVGYTDNQIAASQHVSRQSVTHWRLHNGLPTKHPKFANDACRERRMDEFVAELEAAVLAVEMGEDEI